MRKEKIKKAVYSFGSWKNREKDSVEIVNDMRSEKFAGSFRKYDSKRKKTEDTLNPLRNSVKKYQKPLESVGIV